MISLVSPLAVISRVRPPAKDDTVPDVVETTLSWFCTTASVVRA